MWFEIFTQQNTSNVLEKFRCSLRGVVEIKKITKVYITEMQQMFCQISYFGHLFTESCIFHALPFGQSFSVSAFSVPSLFLLVLSSRSGAPFIASWLIGSSSITTLTNQHYQPTENQPTFNICMDGNGLLIQSRACRMWPQSRSHPRSTCLLNVLLTYCVYAVKSHRK